MYFKPPQNNMTNPFYHPLNKQPVQEAVTVDIEFKKDADGAAAVGSETGRRGLVVSGKKVKDKVYKMTFTNNAIMNKFMDKYEGKLNEGTEELEEAVTVEMQFKTDADGAAAVGSETKSRGMLISGQKVKNKVYRLTFKNNNVMNQFMKTYDNKLDEEKEMDPAKHVSRSKRNPDMFCVFDKDGEEVKLFKEKSDAIEYAKKNHDALMESTPEYRAMMKKYKGSDMEKVFKILDKEGFRMGEQSDTLVRNMLKKHRGNVKKAADQIMKDNPGMFDVNRMMMDDVQIDEMSAKQHYNKMVAQGKVGRGGRLVTPIDKDRFPNREKEGLEGPFRSRKSGQVYYYDRKAGKYYDPLSDMFLQVKDVMENTATYDVDEYLSEEND